MVRETRHLWVGNLPENVREEKIVEHFKRYGRVESIKILPKKGSEGVAAFVDFVDIKSAQKAHNSVNKMGNRDLRTNFNKPGTIRSAARGLDNTVSIASCSREVSGFRGGGGGPTYGPPPSLHAREGRYERRLDGASDNRERAYEHSAYGHHERGTGGFDRTRHYDQDYYRDPRERTLQHGLYYSSRSRSPSRFDTHEPRAREQFTLPSVVHRDIYRDDLTREVRGRRPERNYQHSRSRSPHSSQSRTRSPQRLASQASRPTRSPSGCALRSRSISSSSNSSDRSDSNDESPAWSVQSTAVPVPTSQLLSALEKDEPRKSFGIKVQNLPVRSTDTSLKDGLFHEFKKYGKVTSVQIHGASEERYGLVLFRQQENQEKALNASKGKLFFGMQIDVMAWIGPETKSENEFRPLDERIDEFHPKASRTLFIGNLEKTTTYRDLRNIFHRFGGIVDIDIKKLNGVPQYAFLQYCDIASVCKAIKKMNGEYLGNNRLKLGFGKTMPTNCVWLDGLSTNVTEQYLTRHFCRYGPVVKVVFDRLKGMALILYNEIEYAQAAVNDTKGRTMGGNQIKVDFANRESQLAFYHSMEKTGQDIRDVYEMLTERRDKRRASYDYAADRTYYGAAKTPRACPEVPRREFPARGRDFYANWDPYQGDYYDPQYYDDPQEYRGDRDYRVEQDIREYSYRQRERKRFESARDHERRPTERRQSPHSRQPQSPGASPSQLERLQSDSERRIYSRPSERSSSCSSGGGGGERKVQQASRMERCRARRKRHRGQLPQCRKMSPDMEPAEVNDRILHSISLSVKKLQSYFAACEDETPAIRNHDKVLQRLCEHIDHALLYGLEDLTSGYWTLVVHFTRREAIEQIEELQHVATNLGRSRAWLYLALNENSLESYLRLFQENLSLLHKYYDENALVCSQDHLTLFLTLVSGLEFIRFDLDLDAPYLDLAPYMPDYYKPQHLLDFEDRLPCSVHSSDSLSLNSFNSVTSANLEWDNSAIAPSSEDGDLTDPLGCLPKSPTPRHNPFNKKVDVTSSADTTPIHSVSQEATEGMDRPESDTELEVISRGTERRRTD